MKTKVSNKKAIFQEWMKTLHYEGQVILDNGAIIDFQEDVGYCITSEGATETDGISCACGFSQDILFQALLNDWDAFDVEPLVTKAGTITTDEPLFMCCWNGDDYQIHTRTTLWENFKDTNLFDADEDGWRFEGYHQNNVNFNILLKRLECNAHNDGQIYQNDNMTIKRIK